MDLNDNFGVIEIPEDIKMRILSPVFGNDSDVFIKIIDYARSGDSEYELKLDCIMTKKMD